MNTSRPLSEPDLERTLLLSLIDLQLRRAPLEALEAVDQALQQARGSVSPERSPR
jgi:hypothetical protein